MKKKEELAALEEKKNEYEEEQKELIQLKLEPKLKGDFYVNNFLLGTSNDELLANGTVILCNYLGSCFVRFMLYGLF